MSPPDKPKKQRLDQILVLRGMAENLAKAGAIIMSGNVFLGNKRLDKPGQVISENSAIEIKSPEHPWVSRGGMKLAHAIKEFSIDVKGKVALDIGASTGGFTDVLISSGAVKVYAVDVGFGQIAWKLRQNEKVIVLDRTNAKALSEKMIPEKADIIVCDASFIGLKSVLEKPLTFAGKDCILLALIKPQFEVRKNEVGEGGIVRDEALHRRVCGEIEEWLKGLPGWKVLGLTESPIKGMEGNKEFLIAGKYGGI